MLVEANRALSVAGHAFVDLPHVTAALLPSSFPLCFVIGGQKWSQRQLQARTAGQTGDGGEDAHLQQGAH